MADIQGIARRLLEVYRSGTPIAPIRSEISGIDQAYAVQRATVAAWIAHGRKPAGHKIGLTSPAVQAQLGVGEPDFGALFADMVLPNGVSVPRGLVLQPRIEGEIAFVLKADLDGDSAGKITPAQVIAATDYVTPAIEICGSRIANWDIRIEDTIADDASSGLIVLSGQRSKPDLAVLAAAPMLLRKNDDAPLEGRGDACLGNPANAVAWLGEALLRYGAKLKAGDIVMSGALAKMLSAEPGSRFSAEFGALGSVAVSFAS
jgi:2-keto-4-pentenoate hydratase